MHACMHLLAGFLTKLPTTFLTAVFQDKLVPPFFSTFCHASRMLRGATQPVRMPCVCGCLYVCGNFFSEQPPPSRSEVRQYTARYSTLCLKKNDNDVAHYNFNAH